MIIATPPGTRAPAPLHAAAQIAPAPVATTATTAVLPPSLGMAACDGSGRLTFLSTALRELVGQSLGSEARDEPAVPQHLYQDDGVTRLRAEHVPLVRARQGEVVTDAVICHRSEDEVATYLRCNAAPVAASDGSVNGAVVFVEDVTAGYVDQQDHRRMQDHLITTLNHGLRTPLTKLVGHAEMLQDMRSQLPVNAAHSLEKVCQAADDLRELADKVSCMAELDTPGWLTDALGEATDTAQDGMAQVPEQLTHADLRSVPKIPLQLVARVDTDRVNEAIKALVAELPRPRSQA